MENPPALLVEMQTYIDVVEKVWRFQKKKKNLNNKSSISPSNPTTAHIP